MKTVPAEERLEATMKNVWGCTVLRCNLLCMIRGRQTMRVSTRPPGFRELGKDMAPFTFVSPAIKMKLV